MKIDLYDKTESFVQSKRFTDWKKEFVKTDLYKRLEITYDNILDSVGVEKVSENSFQHLRKLLTNRNTSLIGFYLIENYLDTKEEILDIGCGINYWKTYYNVYGVDLVHFTPTLNECKIITSDFYEKNEKSWNNIMSQCALHFNSDIEKMLMKVYSLLNKGGKGFISLNLMRLYELDNSTSLTKQLNKLKIIEDIIEEVIVVQKPRSNSLDGNLHIIFKSP